MRLLTSALLTSFLLSSCASSPSEPDPIVLTEIEFVLPPAELLEPCSRPSTSRRIDAELERLAGLVECERGDKAALRAWRATHQGTAPSPSDDDVQDRGSSPSDPQP